MTILFDATRPVNVSRTFGQGILPSRPASRTRHTAADVAQMMQVFGELSDARDAAMDAEFDRRAAEFFTQDALDRGYFLPADLAGHPA
jgi:hypothetical protein